MPGFDSIIGQRLAIRLLQTFLQNGTLPHAMLFTGKSGVGKRKTATHVAMALNCGIAPNKHEPTSDTRPCGRCSSCRQILSSNHPDVQLVEPQGTAIKIEQVRRIIHTLAMKPFGDNQRVIIIAEAQHMTAEAGNALLKVLEEPPQSTTLILTAQQRADLLPTIVSRCRTIRFNPLSPSDLSSHLMDLLKIDGPEAEIIADLAGGSITQAKAMTQNQWQTQRDWLIQASGLDKTSVHQRPPLSSALAFAAQMAAKKAEIQNLLSLLKTWIRDIAIIAYWPKGVINRDKKTTLLQVREHLDNDTLITLWEAVEKAEKDIAAKANLRLTLDIMALNLSGHGQTTNALQMVE